MSRDCQPLLTPGVTSKILWHFTGGPRREDIKRFYERKLAELLPKAPDEDALLREGMWETYYSKLFAAEEWKNPQPKPDKDAFCALVNILQEDLLRVDSDDLLFVDEGVKFVWRQERFCSFCEIPIEHLQYHSARYGKFAIGFHREHLLGPRVRPVHYVLKQ